MLLKRPRETYATLNAGLKEHEDFQWLNVDEKRSNEAELLMFLAARAEFVDQIIAPNINKGTSVVADRFVDSTTAYQCAGRWKGDVKVTSLIGALNAFLTRECGMPTITFFLDIPFEEMVRRQNGAYEDPFESSGREFYERVIKGYRGIAAAEPRRVITLDGTLGEEEIFQKITPHINRLYKLS